MNNNVNYFNTLTEEELKNISEPITTTTKLTDEELDTIIKDISENVPEQNQHLRDIIDGNVDNFISTSENGELTLDTQYFDCGIKEAKVDITEAEDTLDDINKESIKESVQSQAADKFGLNDEEVLALLDVILKYKAKEKFNVYNALPEKIKSAIRVFCMQSNIPATEFNTVAKLVLDEFISEAKIDEVFIDFEKSIKEALDMPNIVDLYAENINETMTVKIIEMADKIQEESPEKAMLLRDISSAFKKACSMELMYNTLNNNSRARKAMRRDTDKLDKICDEFNFKNQDSKFKINDVKQMIPALQKILVEDDDRFDEVDVAKFMILWCKTCENMDQNGIVDAAFIYYGTKNVIMMQYTNDNKTPFAAELISNIKDLVLAIRSKEAEFNAIYSNFSNSNKTKY